MASEEVGFVPPQRLENGLNSQLVYQDEALRFNCGAPQRRVGDPGPKTRELSSFMEEKMYCVERDRYFHTQGAEFRRSMYGDAHTERPDGRSWNGNGNTPTPSGEGSEGEDDDDEEDDDDDDDVDEGDGEVEGLVTVDDASKSNNHSSADKIVNGKAKGHSSFGSNRDALIKDGTIVQSTNSARESPSENHRQGRVSHYQNAVTIAEPDGDMYYSPFLQGPEGSASGQKELLVENGCGFSGRKDVSLSNESGESSLKAILSDPLTGALMDDAMILPCGHSFGGGGMQHVIKLCIATSGVIGTVDYLRWHDLHLVSPVNLCALRAAVLAFRREEDLQVYRASKRRRERSDQDKCSYGDSTLMDTPRGRGVQFPFAVTDRVIIKGNKRTPQRFVGREAVVTTQCLNGWYVVKTLDNAESVKLQYRSLAKVSDNPSSKPMLSKMAPNWR